MVPRKKPRFSKWRQRHKQERKNVIFKPASRDEKQHRKHEIKNKKLNANSFRVSDIHTEILSIFHSYKKQSLFSPFIQKEIHSSCVYEDNAISKTASTRKTEKSSLLKCNSGESDVNALG
ncbi:UNVERIFIED_CONTAM: hypothetical protein NCL1_36338 [Trichonephila clavipes]